MSETSTQDEERGEPRLIAEIHVPLSVRHLDHFVRSMELAVGEQLYFDIKHNNGTSFRIISYGEPVRQDS